MSFDKQRFADLLGRAKGNRSINKYGKDSRVDPGYISRLLRCLIDKAPSADIIIKLANKAYDGVTKTDLMTAAGYLKHEEQDAFEVALSKIQKESAPPTIGSRLKKIRDEKSLGQKEVAKAVEISTDELNEIENDRREPDLKILSKLSEFYSISLDWFVHGNKMPIPDDPKYDGDSVTLEDEFARKGLSPEAQRELLEAAIKVMEETKKRYNLP